VVLHQVQKRDGVPPSSFVKRAVVVAAALTLAVWLSAFGTAAVLAQDPSPTPLVPPTDTRSDLLPPGLIGSPLFAALVVVAIGAAAASATVIYVRLVARR
jgi:hypothetical protein